MNIVQQIRTITFFLFFLFLATPLLAQERCGTVRYTEKLAEQRLLPLNNAQFEKWLEKKIQDRTDRSTSQRSNAVDRIPVVVHIIHKGEQLGNGTNITDAQIASQVKVLNQDFRRQNVDASNTPAVFLAAAGSMDVEFVLAKQDPEGLATTGIVRVNGGNRTWSMDDNYALKSLSYWPAEDYLNIWVTDIEDPNNIIGYAQFPVSNLPGLENSSDNALTDGVVIHYKAFGSDDDGNFDLDASFNKGRTATHEIAHFFGLRHIWGDDDVCDNVNDYVTDTPDQNSSTSGCPNHPKTGCNGQPTMFQNFLDYTSDACMNLFTKGQVERMITVLENSPRRASLLTSPALENPVPKPNDLGLREISAPLSGVCAGSVIPQLEVRNYGNNQITQAQIQVKKNGVPVTTQSFTLDLQSLETTILDFPSLTLNQGEQIISFQIVTVNATTDGNANNNTIQRDVIVPFTIQTPFIENFNTLPANWTIINPDQVITWTLAGAPYNTSDNQALKLNFYDYEDNIGELDIFLSPVFDLSTAPVAALTFDVAYGQYSGSIDGLKVIVLTDCNTDINSGVTVYNKQGLELATTTSSNSAFSPSGRNDWRTESINLSAFRGSSSVQLAFVGVNDWGNNLYLDNIRLLTEGINNVSLNAIVSPSPVTCSERVEPIIIVENSGVDLSDFDVVYTINNQSFVASYSDVNLPSGTEVEVTLPPVILTQNINTISFEITNLNGQNDFDPSDNFLTQQIVLNKTERKIPFRETFEEPLGDRWAINNPANGMSWSVRELENNKAIWFNGFDNTVTNATSWLVSPVFDFSQTDRASLFFDLSYVYKQGARDRLQIFASTNCGEIFNLPIREYTARQLSPTNGSTSWQPRQESDWRRQYVNLNALTGLEEVRLAFVYTSNNGNNIYLDNIEIFLSDDPDPIEIANAFAVYPNPASNGEVKVTFNLASLQDVTLEVISSMGQLLSSKRIPGVLNQTYDLDLNNAAPGIYIVQLKTATTIFYTRLLIKN